MSVDMFRFTAVALAALGCSTAADAQAKYTPPFTQTNIAPLAVVAEDNATGGCWTDVANTVADAYAELGYAGLETSAAAASSVVVISVTAQRIQGECTGAATISLRGTALWEGTLVRVTYMEPQVWAFTGVENANQIVRDLISDYAWNFLAGLPGPLPPDGAIVGATDVPLP